MKEIIEQYGGAIATVIAIVALIGIITILLAADDNGVVFSNFKGIFDNMFQRIPANTP